MSFSKNIKADLSIKEEIEVSPLKL